MLLRRWISRSRILRSPCSAGSFRSLSSATISNKPPGWRPRLMLPPVLGGGTEIVGCSHGWVAVLNKRNNDLCLRSPLSSQHKASADPHITDPDFNLDLDGRGSVTKVILSSSPDDEDCRAMMTFGPGNRLAFCLPGLSSEWTPIGDPFFDLGLRNPLDSIAKVHEDLVYCTRRKVFTSVTACHLDLRYFHLNNLEACCTPERYDRDIQVPNFPQVVGSELLFCGRYTAPNSWLDKNIELLENECIQIPHLLSDQLFFVMQLCGDGRWPLGYVPSCEVKGLSGVSPGKTFGFIVMRMNDEDLNDGRKRELNDQRLCTVVDDLNGMSMFVGINHSFAVSAPDKFKPNSIYFTDAKRLRMVCADDTGVFDYATKTISPSGLVRELCCSY